MFLKIFRGAAIGVLLGVTLGIIVPTVLKLKVVIDKEAELYAKYEDQVVGAFGDGTKSIEEVKDQNLEEIMIRFHVRANSNREEDMQLKYKVRDKVLEALGDKLTDEMTREEVEKVISDNLAFVKQVAEETIREEGYGYAVKAYITKDNFPIRQYGQLVLPAGEYEALRIDIGAARGENFWCLLYPSMCFTKEAGAVISDENNLKEALTDEQYDKLFIKRDAENVKIKFKILELLGL